MLDRKLVIQAISEMARNRSITHVCVSSVTYQIYSESLTKTLIKKGLKRGTVCQKGLLVIPDQSDNMVISFDAKNTVGADLLLDMYRLEEWEACTAIMQKMIDDGTKRVHYCEIEELDEVTEE